MYASKPGRQRLFPISVHGKRGECDHGKLRELRVLADLPQRCVAIHLRHLDIHENDVRMHVLNPGKRVFPVNRLR